MIFEGTIPDLSRERIIVILWHIHGCEHCKAYLPKFRAIARHYAHCLPIMILDANAPHLQGVADLYKIQGVPSTMVLWRGGKAGFEGDAEPAQIDGLFQYALRGLSCPLG